MMTIRDILFTEEAKQADTIFINVINENEEGFFEKENGRIKEILTFLGGKSVVPCTYDEEVQIEHTQQHTIYETNLGIIVTLTKYK